MTENKDTSRNIIWVVVVVAVALAIWATQDIDNTDVQQQVIPSLAEDMYAEHKKEMAKVKVGYEELPIAQSMPIIRGVPGDIYLNNPNKDFVKTGIAIGHDGVTYLTSAPADIHTNEYLYKAVAVNDDRLMVIAAKNILTLEWVNSGDKSSRTFILGDIGAIANIDDLYDEEIQSNPFIISLAATNEKIYVADAGNKVIRVIDIKTMKEVGILGEDEKNGGKLNVPRGYLDVAIGPDGEVRVVNPGEHSIKVYSKDGKLKNEWGSSGIEVDDFVGCANPAHIATLPDGGYVTAEKDLPRIKTYDQYGRFVALVATHKDFDSDNAILDIAVDKDGKIYVLDGDRKQVRVFEKIGEENE